jgi:hypothetical protein
LHFCAAAFAGPLLLFVFGKTWVSAFLTFYRREKLNEVDTLRWFFVGFSFGTVGFLPTISLDLHHQFPLLLLVGGM